MTTNHHTPLSTGAQANVATINNPLSQLDSAISALDTDLSALQTDVTDLINGAEPFVQVNLGEDTELTIAGGIVTATRTMHIVDTELDAATDDLVTINGGVDGDWLIISCVNAAREVVIKHNTGNIYTAHQGDIILNDIRKKVVFYYDATNSRWVQNMSVLALRTELDTTVAPVHILRVPNRVLKSSGPLTDDNAPFLEVMARPHRRMSRTIQAAAAALAVEGVAAQTTAGTLTEANQDDAAYINFAITATTGSFGGFISASFDLTRRQYDPFFGVLIRTSTVITVLRVWIGLTSAAIGNTDDPGGAGTSFIGFRYSTVAADPAWMAVTSDGATTNTSSTGQGLSTSTAYRMYFWVDSANGQVHFSVNESGPTTLSANLPATTTELGFQVRMETRENVAKNLLISRMYCEQN